ncbi:MAG: 50S ribosomal protein L24 [Chloroflexi bacterium]|nr:50S ribosomal protein L24 [Chloroflexota bacterium]
MSRIKRDDMVEVRKGRERGKRGRVREVLANEGRAIVAEINVVKKHVKPGQQARQAGIIDMEAPLQLANLALVCSKCGKPTRVGTRLLEDGSKSRYCKTCGELT